MDDREKKIDALLNFQRDELRRLTPLRDDVDAKLAVARARVTLAADRVSACRGLVRARRKGAVIHEAMESESLSEMINAVENGDVNGVLEPSRSSIAANGAPGSRGTLPPVGMLYTSLQKRYEAPRQSFIGPTATGVLHLEPHFKASEEITPDSRLVLLYWFDRNGDNWRTHVKPPRRVEGAGRIGVLATRSPNRPTPIGLSFGDVVRVDGNRIYLRGLDVLDETPVISVRLYNSNDRFVDSRMGWLDDKTGVRPLHYDVADKLKRVEFDDSVMEKLRVANVDAEVVRSALARGHGRDGILPQGAFRILFEARGANGVLVTEVVSGMRKEVCDAEAIVDPELAIHARFKKLEDIPGYW